MKTKIKVGILGATGMVGQYFIALLRQHPWFEVSYVAASTRSAGKTYGEAVRGRWKMDMDIPGQVNSLQVNDAQAIEQAKGRCQLLFSAVKLDKQAVKELESVYAAAGFAVVSANSAHRATADVPVLIPEINHQHLDVIQHQRQHYG